MGSGSSAFHAFKAVSGSENRPCGGDSFRFANFVLLQPNSDALLCQNAPVGGKIVVWKAFSFFIMFMSGPHDRPIQFLRPTGTQYRSVA